jgi:SAM-dependent methyltransferase
VDISKEMVRQGKIRLKEYPQIHPHHTDGSLDMFPDNRFDFCFSILVFQHIPEKRFIFRYFEEVSRVLKPRGIFRFQVDGRSYDTLRTQRGTTWAGVVFSEAEMKAVLPPYGFEILEMYGQETQLFWITAQRLAKPAISMTALMQGVSKPLQIHGVQRFIARLCPEKMRVWSPQLMEGSVSVRRLAEYFLNQTHEIPAEDFVRQAYQTFLNRPPDTGGMNYYLEGLRQGLIHRNELIEALISSGEFHDLLSEGRDAN